MNFYYMDMSAPCRAVMLTAEAVGVKLNKKYTDVFAGETLTPQFIAINQQHCIPTLVDGDLNLWESRAICTYLVSKYSKDDSFYPKDPKRRALIDRLLYFDCGTLFPRFYNFVFPVLMQGSSVDKSKLKTIQEALGWFNNDLDGKDFAIGSKITVADHSLVATVSTIVESGIDISNHTNIVNWFRRCQKQMPGYERANDKGAKEFGAFAKPKLGEL